MGDLNLYPQDHEQEQKLVIIKGRKKTILNEITTKQNKQLDHILASVPENILVYTTSFKNFISDHRSITMRISDENSLFVDDPRLIGKKQP